MDDRGPAGRWRLKATRLKGQWLELGGLEVEFRDDGTYTIRHVPCVSEDDVVIEGQYKMHGDRMSRSVNPGVKLNDFEIAIAGDEMTFQFPDGKQFLLAREAAAAEGQPR